VISRVLAVAIKEFRQMRRDPRALALSGVIPAALLILFGYGITTDIKNVPMAVLDRDDTSESRELISKFSGSGFFTVVEEADTYGQLDRLFDRNLAKISLVIPKGFSRSIGRGEEADVQVLVDGSDSNTANVVLGYVREVLRGYSERLVVERLRREGMPETRPPIDYRPRVWYNPELRSHNFIVPGLAAIIMMILGVLMTSMAIAKEKEMGTMEHIMVSPIRAYEIIIGKIIPYIIVALFDTSVVLAIGWFLFGVPMRGNLGELFVATLFFLTSTLGLGLLISTLVGTQQAAMAASFLAAVLPSYILSGFIFPIRSMPKAIQLVTYLIPAKYYLIVLRGILIKGVGLLEVWGELIYLIAFAALTLILSFLRMRKVTI